ncbi:carboxypeptidase regulatory-like domain-containing protein [Mucilaginibacter ximonensis]|uniref:Carboxypeptidase regulatory-like domain-containing protein n=1 Tax=Mucilaginibacter ximonensis TaxID=538021 RepID=A0ABW5Y8D3_9SPHI
MIYLNKWVAVALIWLLLPSVCLSQTLKGTVTDSLNKPVAMAGVNLKNSKDLIIAYTTTNNKGDYALQIPANTEKNGLKLEVSCLGFKKATREVVDLAAAYNFKLTNAVNQLKTVVVKNNRPYLRTSGDTLSYKVSDFSSPQDRVIGDVLKRLPGIDVDKDGKVSYNGKAISNLYIGGDNLLDDRYNIATRNIPQGVVDEMQVIQNHQPIRMLQGKVNSDAVAINLTIKKNAKMQLIGQEKFGAGLPGNYDVDVNAMMFKDKYKAINYLKGNNIGYDVASELISHNSGSYMSGLDNNKPSSLLSLGTAGDPDLPRNRYLTNQSGLFNVNNLVNVRKDLQLRVNLSYMRDRQLQNYFRTSDVYLPGDTVHYTETQHNKNRPDLLHAQFTVNINNDKYYLNDNLSTDYSHRTGYSSLVTNNVPVNQVLKDNMLDLSNDFNLMKTLKNSNIIEASSYINHTGEPENRVIDPGLNPDIFNNNAAYAQLIQNVNIPGFFTNNYLNYRIPKQYVTQSYRMGFSRQSQQLNSDLSVMQLNKTVNLVSDSAKNNLGWSRNKIYTEADYDITGQKLKATFSLPLTYLDIAYNDRFYKLDKTVNRLYFDPSLFMKYQTGVENNLTATYNFHNSIGSITDVYRGYILSNYRSLGANNADLTESQTQSASLGFNFRKAIILLFFNINASYTHQSSNSIASAVLSNNIQQRIVLPYANSMNAWALSSKVSKYDFALRTTFSLGGSWQTASTNQIQNGLVLPYNTINTNLNFGIETKAADRVTLSYNGNYNVTTSKSSAVTSTSKFERLIQSASANYNITDYLFLNVSGDHYYTRQQNAGDLKYIFADASIRYRFKKTKLDVELDAQNLFNTKNYTAVYLSANMYAASSYTIPGRIIMAKATFSL